MLQILQKLEIFEIDCTHNSPTKILLEEFETAKTNPTLDNSVEVQVEEQARK